MESTIPQNLFWTGLANSTCNRFLSTLILKTLSFLTDQLELQFLITGFAPTTICSKNVTKSAWFTVIDESVLLPFWVPLAYLLSISIIASSSVNNILTRKRISKVERPSKINVQFRSRCDPSVPSRFWLEKEHQINVGRVICHFLNNPRPHCGQSRYLQLSF